MSVLNRKHSLSGGSLPLEVLSSKFPALPVVLILWATEIIGILLGGEGEVSNYSSLILKLFIIGVSVYGVSFVLKRYIMNTKFLFYEDGLDIIVRDKTLIKLPWNEIENLTH